MAGPQLGQGSCLPPVLQEQRASMRWDARGLGALAWSLAVAVAVAQRAPANSVLYECNRTSVHLVVQMDPWGAGLGLDPEYLRLGSCSPSFEDRRQRLFHFERNLKECGFARLRSGRTVEYSAHLVYRPLSSQSGLYNGPFAERINCTTYEAQPWVPAKVASVTGHLLASSGLLFTAMFMKEDFTAPSDSATVLLGTQIHIEFAVQNIFHQPLQVFVDECVAATSPELSMLLRNHTVVANHGCVVDGKVADSQFLPRRSPDALRLSLQAFGFLGLRKDVYLHCLVFAWDPKVPTDPMRKACSFRRDVNRWQPLDDPTSSVCTCCDSVCQASGFRHRRGLRGALMGTDPLQSNVAVGHLTIRKPSSYEWAANSSFGLRGHRKGKLETET
ncbi:zona pellucida sperm-binding protein 3-like isoform X2 [Sceloporus undulatus]|uniref:zona pellucida sperm-binding protein 3-like isoform X2 n=1 Tax=Sceloporus undulatus TaxID=8520 RepID=UPI001C4ADF98|nr:zona pellucida sperm-binding protein 3-like isoform X2 [Sceloporus undulatus]